MSVKTDVYVRRQEDIDWFICRYGSDAGKFTEHVVHTAGGAAAATYNISNLGVSVMAQRAAAASVVAMAPSSSAAAEAQCGTAADTDTANTQRDSSIPPAYSISAPDDDVSPVSDAVVNVLPSK